MQPYLKLVYSASIHSQNYGLHMWIKWNLFFYHLINVFYHQCNVYYFLEFCVPEFDGETNISLPYPVDSNFIDLDYSLSLLLGQNNCKLFSLPFEVSFPVLFLAQGLLCWACDHNFAFTPGQIHENIITYCFVFYILFSDIAELQFRLPPCSEL